MKSNQSTTIFVVCTILFLSFALFAHADGIDSVLTLNLDYTSSSPISPSKDSWDVLTFSVNTSSLPRSTSFPVAVSFGHAESVNDTAEVTWYDINSVLEQFVIYDGMHNAYSRESGVVTCGISSRLRVEGTALLFETGTDLPEGEQAIAQCKIPVSLFQLATAILPLREIFPINFTKYPAFKVSLLSLSSLEDSQVAAVGEIAAPNTFPLGKWNFWRSNSQFLVSNGDLLAQLVIDAVVPARASVFRIWAIEGYTVEEFSAFANTQMICSGTQSISVPSQYNQADDSISWTMPAALPAAQLSCLIQATIPSQHARPFVLFYTWNEENGRLAFIPSFTASDAKFTTYDGENLSWQLSLKPSRPNDINDAAAVFFKQGPFPNSIVLQPIFTQGEYRVPGNYAPSCQIDHVDSNNEPVVIPATIEARLSQQLDAITEADAVILYIDSSRFNFGDSITLSCAQPITNQSMAPLANNLLSLRYSDMSQIPSRLLDNFDPSGVTFSAPWPQSTATAVAVAIGATSTTELKMANHVTLKWFVQQIIDILQTAVVPESSTGVVGQNVFEKITEADLIPVFGPDTGLEQIDPAASASLSWTSPKYLNYFADAPGAYATFYVPTTFFTDKDQLALVDNYTFAALPSVSLSVSTYTASPTIPDCPAVQSAGSTQRPDFSKAANYSPLCSLGLGDRCFSGQQCNPGQQCLSGKCQRNNVQTDDFWNKSHRFSMLSSHQGCDVQLFGTAAGSRRMTISANFVPYNPDTSEEMVDTIYQGKIPCFGAVCSSLAREEGLPITVVHPTIIPADPVPLRATLQFYHLTQPSQMAAPIVFSLEFRNTDNFAAIWVGAVNASTFASSLVDLNDQQELGYILSVQALSQEHTRDSNGGLEATASIMVSGLYFASTTRRTVPLLGGSPATLYPSSLQFVHGTTDSSRPLFHRTAFTLSFTHQGLGNLTPTDPRYTGFSIFPVGALHTAPGLGQALSLSCTYQGIQLPEPSIQEDVQDTSMWYWYFDISRLELIETDASAVTLTCHWSTPITAQFVAFESLFNSTTVPLTGLTIAYDVLVGSGDDEITERLALAFISQPNSAAPSQTHDFVPTFVRLPALPDESRVVTDVAAVDKFITFDPALSISRAIVNLPSTSRDVVASTYQVIFPVVDYQWKNYDNVPPNNDYYLEIRIRGPDARAFVNGTYSLQYSPNLSIQTPKEAYNFQPLMAGNFQVRGGQFFNTTQPSTYETVLTALAPEFVSPTNFPRLANLYLVALLNVEGPSAPTPEVPTNIILNATFSNGRDNANNNANIHQQQQLNSNFALTRALPNAFIPELSIVPQFLSKQQQTTLPSSIPAARTNLVEFGLRRFQLSQQDSNMFLQLMTNQITFAFGSNATVSTAGQAVLQCAVRSIPAHKDEQPISIDVQVSQVTGQVISVSSWHNPAVTNFTLHCGDQLLVVSNTENPKPFNIALWDGDNVQTIITTEFIPSSDSPANKLSRLLIAVIALLAVCAVAVGIFFVVRKLKASNAESYELHQDEEVGQYGAINTA